MKPKGERWLSLRVEPAPAKAPAPKPILHLSVPKRIVPLATDRNRIKRVLKEAARKNSVFKGGHVYYLKVMRRPEEATLKAAEEAVRLCF